MLWNACILKYKINIIFIAVKWKWININVARAGYGSLIQI